jgi:hypothetical protein
MWAPGKLAISLQTQSEMRLAAKIEGSFKSKIAPLAPDRTGEDVMAGRRGIAIDCVQTMFLSRERQMVNEPVFWVGVATLMVALLGLMRRSPAAHENRRIERKLDLILKHLEIEEVDAGVDERIRALLASGDKIEAVKLYRDLTGVGLKEAKDYVEGL